MRFKAVAAWSAEGAVSTTRHHKRDVEFNPREAYLLARHMPRPVPAHVYAPPTPPLQQDRQGQQKRQLAPRAGWKSCRKSWSLRKRGVTSKAVLKASLYERSMTDWHAGTGHGCSFLGPHIHALQTTPRTRADTSATTCKCCSAGGVEETLSRVLCMITGRAGRCQCGCRWALSTCLQKGSRGQK